MKKLVFAALCMFIAAPAMALNPNVNNAICELMKQFGGVFSILRTLAFVGAGFTIAGWAWGWISKGEVKYDDVQKKGLGMLVGFIVLFSLGAILSAFMAMAGDGGSLGCVADMW